MKRRHKSVLPVPTSPVILMKPSPSSIASSSVLSASNCAREPYANAVSGVIENGAAARSKCCRYMAGFRWLCWSFGTAVTYSLRAVSVSYFGRRIQSKNSVSQRRRQLLRRAQRLQPRQRFFAQGIELRVGVDHGRLDQDHELVFFQVAAAAAEQRPQARQIAGTGNLGLVVGERGLHQAADGDDVAVVH